jgi:hypothetical protein
MNHFIRELNAACTRVYIHMKQKIVCREERSRGEVLFVLKCNYNNNNNKKVVSCFSFMLPLSMYLPTSSLVQLKASRRPYEWRYSNNRDVDMVISAYFLLCYTCPKPVRQSRINKYNSNCLFWLLKLKKIRKKCVNRFQKL